MKTFIIRMTFVVTLLAIGFAAGFPVGNSVGFMRGSEWAIVQADILARQVGQFMPVVFEDGIFRVIMKQPRGLYRRAWQLADSYDEAIRQDSEKSTKTDEIVYALHDQTAEAALPSQEIQHQTADKVAYASQDTAAQPELFLLEVRQQTADKSIYASQDPEVQAEQSSQEGQQPQGADQVASPDREMSGTAISAPTSTTI